MVAVLVAAAASACRSPRERVCQHEAAISRKVSLLDCLVDLARLERSDQATFAGYASCSLAAPDEATLASCKGPTASVAVDREAVSPGDLEPPRVRPEHDVPRGARVRAQVIAGQASIRGALDRQIIRRIVRRHLEEVKGCYEPELVRTRGLAGRIAVQFTIAATGSVVAAVLQNSTMPSPRVENCVVQAVRRWEFPRPLSGGIVIVTFPFELGMTQRL